MSEAVNHWGMTEEDLGLIDLVRQEIWEWRSVCQSPQHLLALGTIVSGLDALLAGNPPDARSAQRFRVGELLPLDPCLLPSPCGPVTV